MTDIALRVGAYILLHGTVVLVCAWGLVWMNRDGPAALTHAVWTAAFTVLLLLPVGGYVVPGWTVDLTMESSPGHMGTFTDGPPWREGRSRFQAARPGQRRSTRVAGRGCFSGARAGGHRRF
ncbi:hypothetical protein [Salinibacter sp. 10B]|uniref:hypothetical protein n=1 Tax=Salinibacter sp. 10B TaxID=1923971 RepID=UPI0011AFFA2B|nr:hypothetical protein [Salinibacter sp. 10B]